MQISLQLLPADGDRLEGRISTSDGRVDLSFSGTLDLLRAIAELRASQADLTAPREPSSC